MGPFGDSSAQGAQLASEEGKSSHLACEVDSRDLEADTNLAEAHTACLGSLVQVESRRQAYHNADWEGDSIVDMDVAEIEVDPDAGSPAVLDFAVLVDWAVLEVLEVLASEEVGWLAESASDPFVAERLAPELSLVSLRSVPDPNY